MKLQLLDHVSHSAVSVFKRGDKVIVFFFPRLFKFTVEEKDFNRFLDPSQRGVVEEAVHKQMLVAEQKF